MTKRNELCIERYGHVSQHVQPFEVLVQYDQMTRLDVVECESRNVLMIAMVEHEGESVVGPVLNLFTVRHGIDQGDRCGGEVVLWKKNGLLLLFHHHFLLLLLLFVMMTILTIMLLLFLNLLKVVMVEGGNGGEGGQCRSDGQLVLEEVGGRGAGPCLVDEHATEEDVLVGEEGENVVEQVVWNGGKACRRRCRCRSFCCLGCGGGHDFSVVEFSLCCWNGGWLGVVGCCCCCCFVFGLGWNMIVVVLVWGGFSIWTNELVTARAFYFPLRTTSNSCSCCTLTSCFGVSIVRTSVFLFPVEKG